MGKIMGNIVGLPSPRSDWNQTDETKADYIKNKPLKEIQAMKSLQYYGDANIVPSDANLFNFITDDATMTAKISANWGTTLGDLVIPYECEVDGKIYKITGLDGYAFEGCNITSVIFPNSIKDLDYCAFSGASGFTTIAIPNGVSKIPLETFFMGSLRTIKIPSSVKYIEEKAFASTSLTDVYFKGTKEQWNAIEIGTENEPLLNATIHYEWVNATKGYVDEKISEVKPTIIKEEADVGEASITMEDNHIYFAQMVLNNLVVTIPEEMGIGYTSALYFFTPDKILNDYTSFPENIKFKGDSVEDEKFIPEANMRYTIVFDYDGFNVIGYVSGVTLL